MLDELYKMITEELQDFCDREDFDVTVDNDTEFYCYTEDNEVFYTLQVLDFQAEWFMENAFNNGLKYDCGNFLLSFLHEIGHCQTEPLLTKGQRISRTKRKKGLDGNIREDNFYYFNLVDEKMATDWAIEYANTHKKELRKLARNIQKILAEY